MVPEVFDNFNRPKKALLDWTKQVSKVEKAGYVSSQKRIEQLIVAGKRLVVARDEMYDTIKEVDIDAVEIDPTRRPGYDISDASMALQSIAARKAAVIPQKSQNVDSGESSSKGEVKDEQGESK